MHSYFVSYEVESVGKLFQKLYRRSTIVTIAKPIGERKEDLALIRAELAIEISAELGFDVEKLEDIWIASLTHTHSRPYGGGR